MILKSIGDTNTNDFTNAIYHHLKIFKFSTIAQYANL